MNKHTVAICYSPQASNTLLELVRSRTRSFGLRCELFADSVTQATDPVFRRFKTSIFIPQGFDLVIILCDNSFKHTEYNILGHFNHILTDPWATCVLTVSSLEYKGYQPTVAIEDLRYMGHFFPSELPLDLWESLCIYRQGFRGRGLSDKEWKSILSYASAYVSQVELDELLILRKQN